MFRTTKVRCIFKYYFPFRWSLISVLITRRISKKRKKNKLAKISPSPTSTHGTLNRAQCAALICSIWSIWKYLSFDLDSIFRISQRAIVHEGHSGSDSCLILFTLFVRNWKLKLFVNLLPRSSSSVVGPKKANRHFNIFKWNKLLFQFNPLFTSLLLFITLAVCCAYYDCWTCKSKYRSNTHRFFSSFFLVFNKHKQVRRSFNKLRRLLLLRSFIVWPLYAS